MISIMRDLAPTLWVTSKVEFSTHTVESLLPPGFEAYARILHPAYLHERESSPENLRTVEVSWTDVARQNGRAIHPGMEWASITGSWRFINSGGQAGIWDEPPLMGLLPFRQAQLLVSAVEPFTRTSNRCWFGVWDGWNDAGYPEGSPTFVMPRRRMALLAGPISALAELGDIRGGVRASLWWPDDRSWCIATDVDLLSTYVGAPSACIESMIGSDELEIFYIPRTQGISWETDTVNPPPEGGPC